ncbi:MAG: hypothetical protein JW709_13435, partial [Sedimentisphaerales bacterium]|nr:hypothetical protein [Sedimentisphaerales bacterium]
MNKKLAWKFVLIGFIAFLCIWETYPPDAKLKPGIDLAGGTSLLYQINTDNLSDYEKKNIAQTMIRILQERVDPGNKMNLVWRPHGFDRIEIQMPLASKESRQKREAYESLRDQLGASNIDIGAVRETLVHPEGMSREDYLQVRARRFEELAGGSAERLEALAKLGEAQDAFEAINRQNQEAVTAIATTEKSLQQAEL